MTKIDKKIKQTISGRKKSSDPALKTEPQFTWKYGSSPVRDVIMRVWHVIVSSSIAYAVVVILIGTDGVTSKIMIVPATLYAGFLLIKR